MRRIDRAGPAGRRRGVFVLLTAVGLITFLGMAALVTDAGYAYAERQRSQTVIDMAGLATLSTLSPSDPPFQNATRANTRVRAIADTNGVAQSQITTVQFTVDGLGARIRTEATMNAQAFLATIFGKNSWSLAVSSVVTGEFDPPQITLDGFGLFGCSSFELRQGAFVDAFDSRLGPYEGPPNDIKDTTRWSDVNGYGPCLGGNNCSARVMVGSFGAAVLATGGSGITVYGGVWSDVSVSFNSGSYVDRDVYCSSCPISLGGSIVNGVVDGNAPSPNLGNCDFDQLMPCDLFTDDVTPYVEAQIADSALLSVHNCDGDVYSLETKRASISLPKNATLQLETGKIYHLTDIDVKMNTTIEVIGNLDNQPPPIVFVENTLDFSKQPIFNITATCKGITPCPAANWTEFTHSKWYGSPNATMFNFKKAVDGVDVIVDIVAPTATLDFDKDMGINGRAIGGQLRIKKDAEFHYDEALGGNFGIPPRDVFRNVRIFR